MEGAEELALTGGHGQTILVWLFCIPLPFNLMTSHGEPGAVRKTEVRSAFVPLGPKHWEAQLRALSLVSSDVITLCSVDGEKTPGSKYSSTSGLSPRGHLERQAEFHASTQDEA